MAQNINLEHTIATAKETAQILKNLSNHMRLITVCYIGRGEKTVQELSNYLGTSQSNMSQHLAKLRSAGILDCRKDKNLVYYRIKDKRALDLVCSMQAIYCEDEKPKSRKS